jgi:hypothetical protein
MTYLAAAEAVLKTAKRPLTVREITEEALRRQLIEPSGRTPEASMSATLYRAQSPHIRRSFTDGPNRAARNSVRWSHAK